MSGSRGHGVAQSRTIATLTRIWQELCPLSEPRRKIRHEHTYVGSQTSNLVLPMFCQASGGAVQISEAVRRTRCCCGGVEANGRARRGRYVNANRLPAIHLRAADLLKLARHGFARLKFDFAIQSADVWPKNIGCSSRQHPPIAA
jgi:hypothetical protein